MNPSGDQSLANRLQDAARQRTVMDVGAKRIGKIYAEALLNAAEKHNVAADVLAEFDALVQDLFARDPDFETFLGSSSIDRDRKKEVLDKTFAGRADEVFVNFLHVLNEHERLDTLRAIRQAYRDLYDERAGLVRVAVVSAVSLDDDQAETLRREIRTEFNKEPVLEARVEPDLIAGMIVQVGDWRLDSSVRSRLQTIQEQLIERSSYEIQTRRDRFSSPDGD